MPVDPIYGPIVLYLALLLVGIPIGYAFFISATAGLILVMGIGPTASLLHSAIYSTVTDFLLLTVPLFLLMAFYLSESDIISDTFYAFQTWLSDLKGGLAMAATIANGGMAVLSGSSTATCASMTKIAVPEMRKYNYDDKLSIGTVAAAGTFATMFPPSIPLIIYGIMTDTSIGALFLAGVIPGVLTLLGYIVVIYAWGSVNPDIAGVTEKTYSWSQRVSAVKPIWPAGIVVVVTLGSLYLGIVTPTEAGAIGAFGAFAVGILFSNLRTKGIHRAHVDTVKVTTVIFIILIGANIFSRYLSVTGLTRQIIGYVSMLALPALAIITILLLVYIFMGALMDQLAILIMTLPITYPIAVELGFGSVWFGIVIVKTIEIGLITPPLGMNVFVATSVIDVETETAFRGAVRFLLVDILVLGLLLFYPDLVYVFLD